MWIQHPKLYYCGRASNSLDSSFETNPIEFEVEFTKEFNELKTLTVLSDSARVLKGPCAFHFRSDWPEF